MLGFRIWDCGEKERPIEKIIKDFPQIFDELNPCFNGNKALFFGYFRIEPFSDFATIKVVDPYTILESSFDMFIHDDSGYHKLHFRVCKLVEACILDLRKQILKKFAEEIKKEEEIKNAGV